MNQQVAYHLLTLQTNNSLSINFSKINKPEHFIKK